LQNQLHENEIIYNGEIAQLTQRLSVHDTETSSSLATQSTLKARLDILEKRAEKANHDHKLWESDMILLANTQEDLNQLTLLHNKLTNDYEAKVESIKSLEIERNNLKLDLASLKTVVSEKNNTITSLEIEKDSLSKHKSILLENQARIEKNLGVISSEKDNLVQTVSDLHIKNVNHEEKINELNTIIVSRNRKIESLEKEAYNNTNQISVLREEGHSSAKSIESYKEKSKELNNIINMLTRKNDVLEVDLTAANNTNRLLKEEIGSLNHQVAKLNEESRAALTAERERMEKKVNDIRASVMDDIQNLELQVSEERKISRKLSAIRESEKEVVEKGRKIVRAMLLDLNISNVDHINVSNTPSKSSLTDDTVAHSSVEVDEESNDYVTDDSKIYPLSRDIMRVASVVHPLKSKITELWKKVTAHYTSNNYYYNSNNSNHDSLIQFASLDEFLLDRAAIDNPALDGKLSMFSLEQLIVDILRRLDIFYLYQKETEKSFNEKQHNYEKVVNELRNLHATVQEKYEKYIQKKSTEEQVTKQEISTLTDELSKFTKSCDRLQEENKSIRNQLDSMHDKYELLRQRKESDDDNSKQQINILQEDNSRYKGTIERISDEHRRAVDALSQATQERLKLSYQLSTQTDINLQLAQETTKLSSIVEEQTTSFGKKESSMKEELDKLLSQNNQLTYQCEAHNRDKRSLTGKNETLQSKIETLQSKLTSFGKKESSMKEELDKLLSQNNQLTYQCEAHIRDKRSLTGKNETLQSKLNELSSAKNEAERLLKRFGDSLPTLSLHNVASKNKSTESVDRAASKGDAIPTFESKDSRMTSPDSYSYSISSPFDNSTPNVSKAVPIHDLLSKVVIKKNVTTPLSSATPSDSVMSSTKKNKEKSVRSLDDNDEWNINGANVSLNMSSPAVALSKSSTPIEKSKLDALKALYSTASSGIKKK
jgi:chromosome segregation ATPase